MKKNTIPKWCHWLPVCEAKGQQQHGLLTSSCHIRGHKNCVLSVSQKKDTNHCSNPTVLACKVYSCLVPTCEGGGSAFHHTHMLPDWHLINATLGLSLAIGKCVFTHSECINAHAEYRRGNLAVVCQLHYVCFSPSSPYTQQDHWNVTVHYLSLNGRPNEYLLVHWFKV